jgi:RsiW-degrading membrane proteinase PrsW (M82 family)
LWLVIAASDRPGPPAKVWSAFFLGAASIFLLRAMRAPFASMPGVGENDWLALALHSIFGVAAPEEALKVLVIVAVSARRRPFADPMDTIVYGAAAGLGFAAYENLAYLVLHAEIWRSLAALRSVLTVPFHGALGIIAGAYLAIARSGTALGPHFKSRSDPACAAFAARRFRFPVADAAAKSGPQHSSQSVAGSGEPGDRVRLDRLCHTSGTTGQPPSSTPHRQCPRPA